MPFYLIRIWLSNYSKPLQGVRFYDIYNVNEVFHVVQKKAFQKISNTKINKIDCFMLPDESEEVKKYKQKNGIHPPQKNDEIKSYKKKEDPRKLYHSGE